MAPSRRPDPLRRPPTNVHSRQLPLHHIDPAVDGTWTRLSGCEHPSALFYGRTGNSRFDDPDAAYGVLYVGMDIQCAFVETFGDSTNANGELELHEDELSKVCVAHIVFTHPLRLVDLTGPGVQAVGADGQICAGDDYPQTQEWSRAFWSHPERPDGIYYRARHDLSRVSVAIFDRASEHVTERLSGSLAADRNRHHRIAILSTYRVNLL